MATSIVLEGSGILSILTQDEINLISDEILEKIASFVNGKNAENDDLKNEFEKHRVNSEQQCFDLEKQLIHSQSSLESETNRNLELIRKVAELEKKSDEISNKFLQLQETHTTCEDELSKKNRALEELQRDKKELVSFVDKRNIEIERLTEEVKKLSEENIASTKAKCEAIAKAEELASQEVSLQYREQRIEQERDLLNKQMEWLNTQLHERSQELNTLRREHSRQMLDLQTQLDEKSEELKLLQETTDNLKNTAQDRSAKYDELAQKLKHARETNIQAEEHFQQQLRAQTKLTDLYKSSAEDSEKRTTELNTAIEELQKIIAQARDEFQTSEDSLLAEKTRLEQENSQLTKQVERLEKELTNANKLLSALKPKGLTAECIESLAPAAAVASNLLKSGKTLTQIYSEYVNVTEQLQIEKHENQKLHQYLQQILQEIEEKAPQLTRQREEYEKSLETISLLTQQLDAAMLDYERIRNQSEEANRKSGYLERENERLRKQTVDLSSQVCTLLKEIEELRGGTVQSSADAIENDEVSSTTTSQDIITKKLITFKHIEELQQQNQQLIAVIRDLSEKQEQAEQEATNTKIEELKGALEKALAEIEELQVTRTKQMEMLDSIMRQKEMYRVLLDQSGTKHPLTSTPAVNKSRLLNDVSLDDTKSALSQLQEDFNHYRKEKADHEKFLNEQLDKMREEASESRLLNAKLSAQLEHSTERFKILETNIEGYKKEISSLNDKNQKLSANVLKQEQISDTLRHDSLVTQEKLSRAEVTINNLRAERDLLKSVETRLVQEKEFLQKEHKGQMLIVANLQSIQNNLERAESETKMKLTNQVEMLEKECKSLRSKLEAEVEHYKNAVKSWEKEMSGLRSRIDAEVQKQQKTRDELIDAYADVHSLNQELNEVKAKLSATEASLRKFGQMPSSKQEKKLTEEQNANKEGDVKDLQLQLTEAKTEIKTLKDQLCQARHHLEQFKNIASSSEEQLKAELETSRIFKETMEKRLEDNLKVHSELEEKIQILEKEKQELIQEKQNISNETLNQSSDLRKELTAVQMELQMALQRSSEAMQMAEDAKRDCMEQSQIAREAQDKYERELILHAADVQALTIVKEQLEECTRKLSGAEEAKEKAEHDLKESRTSWKEQERIFQAEQEALNERCKELETLKENLHDQLERISSQMLALQNRNPQEAVNLSLSEDSNKSAEQLLEIIRYLRREKEIAVTKCEVAVSENQRLQAKTEFLEKQVEELQKTLSEETQKSDVAVATASQHSELMRKVGMLNVLTDSNKLLREEKESLYKRSNELAAKVEQLEMEIKPLQQKSRELLSQRDSLTADNQVLKNEVKRWQTRTNQLVEQCSRTSPEELKRCLQDKENLQKQATQLTEECQRHRAEISRANVQITSLQNELATVKANAQKKEKELERVTEELGAKDTTVAEQNRTIQQVKKIGRKYKTQYDELKVEYDGLKTKMGSSVPEAIKNTEESSSQSQELNNTELEKKLHDAEEQIKTLNEQIKKYSDELEITKKSEQQLKAEANTKEERARKVLQAARNKITQLTHIREDMAKENKELQRKTDAAEQTIEESNLLLNSLRSQFEGRISRLERELKDAQDMKNSQQSILQERESLQREIDELQAKVLQQQKQLEVQQKHLSHHPAPKITPPTGPLIVAVSTVGESPPTANIKPLATPSSTTVHRLPHPHVITSSSSGSGTRTTPTASIRPMAQTRKVIFISTTSSSLSVDNVHEDLSSTSTSVPTHSPPVVPQATIPPTPALVPPVTVTVSPTSTVEQNTCASVIPILSADEETTTTALSTAADAVEEPVSSSHSVNAQSISGPASGTPTVAISPRVEIQPVVESTPEESSDEGTLGNKDVCAIKRIREETDNDVKESTESEWIPQQKRTRLTTATATAPVPSQETAESVEQPAINEINDISSAQIESSTIPLDDEKNQTIEDPTMAAVTIDDDDVIVVESDEDDQGEEGATGIHESSEIVDKDEDGAVVEGVDDEDDGNEGMEGDYSNGEQYENENDEQMQEIDYTEEGGEIMDDEQFEDVAEEMADDDVVQITDDEDEEDNRMESQDDGNSQTERETAEQQELTGTTVVRNTANSQSQFLPRIPNRIERLPSIGRQQQLTPFMSIAGGNFDEGDDSIVPSTPTLFVPRRNDGFAEAVSSPHISQGRFVFGASQEMVVPSSQTALSQLASQGALGVDDTRMDLSQFDESSGRSVPTTPLQVSPPAENLATETSTEFASEPAAPSSPILVPEITESQDIPAITVTSDDNNAHVVEVLVDEKLSSETETAEPIIEEPEPTISEATKPPTEGPGIEEISSSEGESKTEPSSTEPQPVVEESDAGDNKATFPQQSSAPFPGPSSHSGPSQRRPTPIVWREHQGGHQKSQASMAAMRARGRRIRVQGAQGLMRSAHRGSRSSRGMFGRRVFRR